MKLRCSLALGGALALSACGSSTTTVTVTGASRTITKAVTAPTPAPKPVMFHPYEHCGKPEAEPDTIIISCADYGIQLRYLHWARWGNRTATAIGTVTVQGCDPDCADDNRIYSYPITVAAHLPFVCPDGSRIYAWMEWYPTEAAKQDENKPDGGTEGYDC